MAINLNRRSFLRQSSALFAATQVDSLLRIARAANPIPVGLGLFAVEDEWTKDPQATVRALSKMGYQVLEFWAPYLEWTPAQAKDTRKLLDDLGVRCGATHNDGPTLTAEGLPKALELNQILGSKYIVVSGNRNPVLGLNAGAFTPNSGKVTGLEGYKRVGDQLTSFSKKVQAAGLQMGYHNHPAEFKAIDGKRPMDVIAANTPKELMLQLCVGACMESHGDPVEFIKANPGRIRHIHCKDWGPALGHDSIIGEGDAPWRQVFAAAESVGGVEFYLIENLGSKSHRSLATAQRCMANWKKLRA